MVEFHDFFAKEEDFREAGLLGFNSRPRSLNTLKESRYVTMAAASTNRASQEARTIKAIRSLRFSLERLDPKDLPEVLGPPLTLPWMKKPMKMG